MEFPGKVVAVTGAAGGIGLELCRYFARQGAVIAAFDRIDTLADLAGDLGINGTRVHAAVVDIGDSAAVAPVFTRAADALGPIDILINNAGVTNNPVLERTTPESFRDDVNVNVNGAYNCAYAVLPEMTRRRSGVIVNIGSVNGLAAYGDAAYSAGKAAMISLTRSIAMEYGRYGIRANIVCPGTVRTPIWTERASKSPGILAQLARWYPLRRIVEPMEVVHAVAFLASDAASGITGAVLPVDCGLTAGNLVMARELTLEDL
jgi:NAD(P)-dependent dehydrogenase (short-subunit alcohol dehydrogenase family)